MGLSGKYNFPGIQKAGNAALSAVLASTSWGAWLIKSPVRSVFKLAVGFVSNWLANQGLIIVNVGAIYIDGYIDQKAFDAAFDSALEKVKVPGLTEAQKKGIDDEVIKAFRNFGRINRP